jgi:ribosomal protein L17
MSQLAKLGRDSAHRRAMLRNMVTSLIKHETIVVKGKNKKKII